MKKFLLIPLCSLWLMSCNKDCYCTPPDKKDGGKCGTNPDLEMCDAECPPYLSPAYEIKEISSADTIKLGETLLLNITAVGASTCAQSAVVSHVERGSIIPEIIAVVDLEAQIRYCGCICGAALTDVRSKYYFTPSLAGNYEFRTKKADGSYDTHYVYVKK